MNRVLGPYRVLMPFTWASPQADPKFDPDAEEPKEALKMQLVGMYRYWLASRTAQLNKVEDYDKMGLMHIDNQGNPVVTKVPDREDEPSEEKEEKKGRNNGMTNIMSKRQMESAKQKKLSEEAAKKAEAERKEKKRLRTQLAQRLKGKL